MAELIQHVVVGGVCLVVWNYVGAGLWWAWCVFKSH